MQKSALFVGGFLFVLVLRWLLGFFCVSSCNALQSIFAK